MGTNIHLWILFFSVTVYSCDACVRGIRQRKMYKVDTGDTVTLKPTPDPCNYLTNCTLQDFRWYRGADILYRGLYYPRRGARTPYLTERGMADHHIRLTDGYGLVITGVRRADMGVYVFEGRYLSAGSAVQMYLYYANVVPQTQPGEPHIRVKGCVCEGKSFTLTCESDGMNPPVDLTWYRGRQVVTNATVSHSRHNPALVKSRIRIGPAGRSDHGAVYRCVATNKRYPDARAERRMILKVQHLPVWKPKTPNFIVGRKGENATLMCDVTSYPPPFRIDWYFKGKRLRRSKRISYRKKHRILTVSQLSANDFGTYVCTAKNSMGRSKFMINLQSFKSGQKEFNKSANRVIKRKTK